MIKKFIDTFKSSVEKSPLAAIGVSVFMAVLVVLISLTSPYDLFELKLYDLRFRLKPDLKQWEFLTLLDIDDNSIKNVGQFPWPRYIYADGLKVLEETGVRQVTFDTQFMDTSPRFARLDALKRIEEKAARGQRISGEELDKAIINSDKALAEALKSINRSILPYSFLNETLSDIGLDEKARQERAEAYKIFVEKASIPVPKEKLSSFNSLIDPARITIQFPIPQLTRAAHGFGFVDSDFDIDGIARKIRLVRVFNDRVYFHMALAMLIDLCGVKKEKIEIRPGDRIILKDAINPMTLVKRDISIPIDDKGRMYINWAGTFEKTFNHLSFYALLEYNGIKDDIHSFFDDQEIQSGNTERSTLYGEAAKLYSGFENAGDLAARKELWGKILEVRKKITAIEKGYAKSLSKDAEKISAELKKNKSPELEQQLANVQNFITGINIVTEVEKLRDHSVIIGLTGTASHDIGVTPTSSEYLMVGTYPNIINTIIHDKFIHRAGWAVEYALMLLLAVGIGLLVQRLNAVRSLAAIISSMVLLNLANILVFSFANIWVDQLGTSLALLLPALVISSVKFVSEESQKRFIKSAFSHYLSPHVIDEIIKNPESLNLGGELRDISIFFSDVAGFSSISEKLTPPQLVALLNEYLSEMTDIILSFDGTVDKYEGDAIIAFYGAPHPYPDHAVKACIAAIDMKRRLAELRESWKRRGQSELRVRMGINTGQAVVGNMGSRTRMDYTMMGDAVNLASRLEGANKFYSTYAMISENTYEQAKEVIEVRPLDIIRVVGKTEPITVYELLGRKGQLPDYMQEMLEKYNEGLTLFKEWEWDKSRTAFKAALRIVKDDGPSKTYIDRCTEFISSPPPKKWDGVYKLKSK